jgi:hypothetical protein
MKLSEFIEQLQELIDEGHGDLPVFYRHGSSGDCGELSTAFVTNRTDECGPFLEYEGYEKGSNYISIYAGN